MAIKTGREDYVVSVLAHRTVQQAAALVDLLLDPQSSRNAMVEGKPVVRIRRSKFRAKPLGFTQAEVALLMSLSERSVREIEKRAIRKLRAHPELRELWRQFLAGELEESASPLSPDEIAALFWLTRTSAERQVLRKVLRLVQR